jgi:hypothetical protein
VAQVVEPNFGYAGPLDEGLEMAGDVLRVPRQAVRTAEDQTGVGPAAAKEDRVPALLLSHCSEHLDGDGVKGDHAFAVTGLGFAEFGAVADGQYRLADGECSGVEVDRGPGQADGLAAAQPGGGEQEVEGDERSPAEDSRKRRSSSEVQVFNFVRGTRGSRTLSLTLRWTRLRSTAELSAA